MRVLGIETSCDETGIALYDSERGLLADALFSQIDLHRVYGGVVPELASRDHVKRLVPLMREVFAKAGLQPGEVDAVAYTAGPGLVGALPMPSLSLSLLLLVLILLLLLLLLLLLSLLLLLLLLLIVLL